MNGTRLARAASMQGASSMQPSFGDQEIKQGAYQKSPVRMQIDTSYRVLYPWLYGTSQATPVGQGSSADYLAVKSYQCDNPTGNDLGVVTPIFTPQLFDSLLLPIDGSARIGSGATEVQNIDISPGNPAAIGVKGKAHRRLAFINRIPVGRGMKVTPYAFYDFKDPPKDSKYIYTPPQGKNAPGTKYKATGKLDDVVNRPMFESYLGLGLGWDTEDEEGFTPQAVQTPFDMSDPSTLDHPPLPGGIRRDQKWINEKGEDTFSAVALWLDEENEWQSVPGAMVPGWMVPGAGVLA